MPTFLQLLHTFGRLAALVILVNAHRMVSVRSQADSFVPEMGAPVVRRIITAPGYHSGNPFSPAVQINNMLFVSGQAGLDSQGRPVSGGFESECRLALENLGQVLKAANTTFANVVKTTVLLTDMDNFRAMNRIYQRYFPERPPARMTYQVAKLPKRKRKQFWGPNNDTPGVQFEMDAIAIVGDIIEDVPATAENGRTTTIL